MSVIRRLHLGKYKMCAFYTNETDKILSKLPLTMIVYLFSS